MVECWAHPVFAARSRGGSGRRSRFPIRACEPTRSRLRRRRPVRGKNRCTRAVGHAVYRARYYNPYICRFINADPSGFAAGLNFYAFCNDNPTSLEDPFGLDGQLTVGVGGLIGGNPFGGIPPAGFVGGTWSLGVTTSGQFFTQFQASAMVGAGLYGGVDLIGGYTSSASPLPTGLDTTTQVHAEGNLGWGDSIGAGGEIGSEGIGASATLQSLEEGIGFGTMFGVGVATTTTWATPSLSQMWNAVFPPIAYGVYSPITVENSFPVNVTSPIPVPVTLDVPTDLLGNAIQSSDTGKWH